MKTPILALASTLLLSIITVPADITNGLVAYYPLDGDAIDASGNGINGTLYNVTPTTNRFGRASGALGFDPIGGSYIDFGSPALLQFTNDFTISAWCNFSGGTLNPRILCYGEGYGYEILTGGNSDNRQFGVNLALGVFGGGPTFAASQWHFVVAQRTGNIATLFVDGQYTFTNEVSNAPTFPTGLNIGRKSDAGFDSWGGAIDDVRFYNRSLDPLEVEELYLTESPAASPMILQGPKTQTVLASSNATLNVQAAGTPPLSFQWFKNSGPMNGVTNSSIAFPSAAIFDAGNYSIVITNAFGSVTSAPLAARGYKYV